MHSPQVEPRDALVLAKMESHAVLYWSRDMAWSDSLTNARIWTQRLPAERTRQRLRGDAVLPIELAKQWVKPPILRPSMTPFLGR